MYQKLFPEMLKLDNKFPLYYWISLSNKCNANCKFCDIHEKKDINTKVDVFKLLDNIKNIGGKYVQFTGGGEPFANPEIFDYLEYATKLGLNIVFITNGFFLTESTVKRFKNYNIKAIFISIDSHLAKVHNETRSVNKLFERATAGINNIKHLYPNIRIIINHVLNDSNIDDLDKFIALKDEIKYDYLNPIIVKECPEFYFTDDQINDYKNKINLLLELAKNHNVEFLYDDINYFVDSKYLNDGSDFRKNDVPCNALNYASFIDCVSGNVYPCDCSVHRDYDYYCFGNVLADDLEKIYSNDKCKQLREELKCVSKCKSKCDYANVHFNLLVNEKK